VVREGDEYIVLVYGHRICRISPDNTLTMLIDGNEGRTISNTLSSSLHRLAPVAWGRAGKKRYRILPLRSLKLEDNYWTRQSTAPELFVGLQFDLSTGNALNARPDLTDRIDSEARKVWLRALKNFKRHIVMRAKLGVFEAIEKQLEHKGPRYTASNGKVFANRVPDWSDEKWIDLLYTSIRDEVFPKELLAGIVLTRPSVVWSKSSRSRSRIDQFKQTMDHIINTNSVELRAKFGVFQDEVTDNGKEQDRPYP